MRSIMWLQTTRADHFEQAPQCVSQNKWATKPETLEDVWPISVVCQWHENMQKSRLLIFSSLFGHSFLCFVGDSKQLCRLPYHTEALHAELVISLFKTAVEGTVLQWINQDNVQLSLHSVSINRQKTVSKANQTTASRRLNQHPSSRVLTKNLHIPS